jgi:hypothetical protein
VYMGGTLCLHPFSLCKLSLCDLSVMGGKRCLRPVSLRKLRLCDLAVMSGNLLLALGIAPLGLRPCGLNAMNWGSPVFGIAPRG